MVTGKGSTESVLLEEDVRTIIEAGTPTDLFEKKRILVLTPDTTRTCPLPMMIEILQMFMGKRCARLDFMVALGTHTPMPEKSILSLYGIKNKQTFAHSSFFNHEWSSQETFRRIGSLSAP